MFNSGIVKRCFYAIQDEKSVIRITILDMTDVRTTDRKLETFFQQFRVSNFPKNHMILSAGTHSDFLYFVETGAVKMTSTTVSGKNVNLHAFFPQSFFSLLTLITNDRNEYDFITIKPTQLRKVPRSELITFLTTNNDVLWELQLRLLKGINGLLKRIEQSTATLAYNQVASLLLYFSQHMSTSFPKITHQEIANWLGLSRENVSLHMEKLENEGLISTKHNLIEIIDREGLQKTAQYLTVI